MWILVNIDIVSWFKTDKILDDMKSKNADGIRIITYSDESGQDTKGKIFVVCTAILKESDKEEVQKILSTIENESCKTKKWSETTIYRKNSYSELLLKYGIFKKVKIYVSVYENTKEYTVLVGSNIAKAILTHTDGNNYSSKIFIDRTNKREMEKVKKEIKKYKIKYKKIRDLSDTSDVFVRLVDHACGVKRNIGRARRSKSHLKVSVRLIEI